MALDTNGLQYNRLNTISMRFTCAGCNCGCVLVAGVDVCSLQVWMCGGKVLISTCSRVGHVFRKVSPYTWPGGVVNILNHNTMRTAEVWMDKHKEFFYKVNPCMLFLSTTSSLMCIKRLLTYYSHTDFFTVHILSWAWWDWPLTWLTNHRPSVLRSCWLDHLTRKIVSETTYNVSSETLNPTIPYHWAVLFAVGICCRSVFFAGSTHIFPHTWYSLHCL